MEVKREATISMAYLDVLRWISMVAIVLIHVAGYVNDDLRMLWNWAIPVFVMISGTLFLNPMWQLSIKKLLFKYVNRVVLTIVLVGTGLNTIHLMFLNQSLQKIDYVAIFIDTINGKTPDHFWFLYMILGMYLMIPLMKSFVGNASNQVLSFVLVVLFLANGLVPELKRVFDINLIFYLPITSMYFFYFMIGYAIHHRGWFHKLTIMQLIFIVGVCLIPFFLRDGLVFGSFSYSYHSPLTCILAIGVFLLAKKGNASSHWLSQHREMCFTVYLIHPLILEGLLFQFDTKNMIGIAVATVGLSVLFAFLIHQVRALWRKRRNLIMDRM